MKEIVIISGKGGTGKTSLTASFAHLASGHAVLVDCDVDAADLHLILHPRKLETTPFYSGHKAVVNHVLCTDCGICRTLCRFGAVKTTPDFNIRIDPVLCEGCGLCVRMCPQQAICFPKNLCGQWFVSETRFGPLVHARLGVASENSGRLVTLLRQKAAGLAEDRKADFVIIDGSPGIGCPVIASLTGASFALIVTEPTVSGEHDFLRIAELTRKLNVPAMVCVNKWDINPERAAAIRDLGRARGIPFAGFVRYGNAVTAAQRAGKAVLEFENNGMAGDIRKIWDNLPTR